MDRRAVCLNCIDGRVQIPVIRWIIDNCGTDNVDMITEPGIDGILSDRSVPIDSIISKIKISIDKNNASTIFIVGHYDCRGNPVDGSLHKEQIKASVIRIKEEFEGIKTIGLWVNDNWEIEQL